MPKMKKVEQEELDKIMDIIANLFGRVCFMCGGSYDEIKNKRYKKTHKMVPGKRKSFVVHHRKYKKYELKYSAFKTDGKYDRLAYYRYLLPILITEHMIAQGGMEHLRFRFIHSSHHHRLEEFARYKPQTLENAISLVREINQAKYNNKDT